MRMQTFIGAMRKTGVHGPCLIGRVEHLIKRIIERQRQALPTVNRVTRQCWPASFDELLIRCLEALWRCDGVGGDIEMAALTVTRMIQRKEDVGRKLAALFQHLIDGVGIELGMRRQLPELGVELQ